MCVCSVRGHLLLFWFLFLRKRQENGMQGEKESYDGALGGLSFRADPVYLYLAMRFGQDNLFEPPSPPLVLWEVPQGSSG